MKEIKKKPTSKNSQKENVNFKEVNTDFEQFHFNRDGLINEERNDQIIEQSIILHSEKLAPSIYWSKRQPMLARILIISASLFLIIILYLGNQYILLMWDILTKSIIGSIVGIIWELITKTAKGAIS